MNRRDLVTSLVLLVFGVAVVAESLRMPRYENLGVDPFTAPGVVPGALGVTFVVFGLVMLARTWAARSAGATDTDGTVPADADGTRRLLISLALMLGFAVVLVGLVPFWLATFLFVTGFILVFEAGAGRSRAMVARAVSVAVVEGALVAAAVTYVFERIFLVRLP